MADKDEAPETEKAADKAADAVEDAQDATDKPEPEHEAKDTAEDVPEWGKQLIADVKALSDAVAKPVTESVDETLPEHGEVIEDDTPVRRPWHKRGLMRD